MDDKTIEKLKRCEQRFLTMYPKGFDSDDMRAIEKKHKPAKMIADSRDLFDRRNFDHPDLICESMSKFVGRSSMVSLFEKPKFRDFVKSLGRDEKKSLSQGLFELIHGDEEVGFNNLIDLMAGHKIAKWSLVSVYKVYYNPNIDVFVKPTTAKSVLQYFSIDNLIYKPRPVYDFYTGYRTLINALKAEAGEELQVSNMAFTGFLMMSMDEK